MRAETGLDTGPRKGLGGAMHAGGAPLPHPRRRPRLLAAAVLLLAAALAACAPQFAHRNLTFDPRFRAVDTDERESAGWRTARVLFLPRGETEGREAMVVLLHTLPEGAFGLRQGFAGLEYLEVESGALDRLMANPVQYMRAMDEPADPLNEVRHGLHWALMGMARRGLPLYGQYRAVAHGMRMEPGLNKTVVLLFAPERLEPGDGWHADALARFEEITGQRTER